MRELHIVASKIVLDSGLAIRKMIYTRAGCFSVSGSNVLHRGRQLIGMARCAVAAPSGRIITLSGVISKLLSEEDAEMLEFQI
jgi:hypothetical protein